MLLGWPLSCATDRPPRRWWDVMLRCRRRSGRSCRRRWRGSSCGTRSSSVSESPPECPEFTSSGSESPPECPEFTSS
eukprot:9111541-Pyramimonas_sp.AAC.1